MPVACFPAVGRFPYGSPKKRDAKASLLFLVPRRFAALIYPLRSNNMRGEYCLISCLLSICSLHKTCFASKTVYITL